MIRAFYYILGFVVGIGILVGSFFEAQVRSELKDHGIHTYGRVFYTQHFPSSFSSRSRDETRITFTTNKNQTINHTTNGRREVGEEVGLTYSRINPTLLRLDSQKMSPENMVFLAFCVLAIVAFCVFFPNKLEELRVYFKGPRPKLHQHKRNVLPQQPPHKSRNRRERRKLAAGKFKLRRPTRSGK